MTHSSGVSVGLSATKGRAILAWVKRNPEDPEPREPERPALLAAAESLERQATTLRRRAARLNGRKP